MLLNYFGELLAGDSDFLRSDIVQDDLVRGIPAQMISSLVGNDQAPANLIPEPAVKSQLFAGVDGANTVGFVAPEPLAEYTVENEKVAHAIPLFVGWQSANTEGALGSIPKEGQSNIELLGGAWFPEGNGSHKTDAERDTFIFRDGGGEYEIFDFNAGYHGRDVFVAGHVITIDVADIDNSQLFTSHAQQTDTGVLFDAGNGDDLFLRETLLKALNKDSFAFV